jgi:glycosyltransferase involved in cell wall biosynthesis
MAEFGSPRHPSWFTLKGATIVGTFHCSARRLPTVLGNFKCLGAYSRISVMSKEQIPFFVSRGFPADLIDVTLHGVDTAFYCPATEVLKCNTDDTLRLFLVGSTERDHEFAAAVMKELEGDPVRLDVLTAAVNHAPYAGLRNVSILPFLDDIRLRETYRNADLIFMPMLDCTANNALLEAMACGTPVMTNRIGGIPEYVGDSCSIIMEGKKTDEWAARVRDLSRHREVLNAMRQPARAWAMKFTWAGLAPQYLDFYQKALAQNG